MFLKPMFLKPMFLNRESVHGDQAQLLWGDFPRHTGSIGTSVEKT